jgi:hypothetical protein
MILVVFICRQRNGHLHLVSDERWLVSIKCQPIEHYSCVHRIRSILAAVIHSCKCVDIEQVVVVVLAYVNAIIIHRGSGLK